MACGARSSGRARTYIAKSQAAHSFADFAAILRLRSLGRISPITRRNIGYSVWHCTGAHRTLNDLKSLIWEWCVVLLGRHYSGHDAPRTLCSGINVSALNRQPGSDGVSRRSDDRACRRDTEPSWGFPSLISPALSAIPWADIRICPLHH
jgi:hypothetical protein